MQVPENCPMQNNKYYVPVVDDSSSSHRDNGQYMPQFVAAHNYRFFQQQEKACTSSPFAVTNGTYTCPVGTHGV
eukprot:NODE_4045_length_364_cov_2.438095_g3465_i0.p1 GENE.NODE_4045_length_364_cov_2.438095_g3465_i0~~NODE_4045_length_364_cov_2.438095_g3465_i0.p1  ORF type:complete len:74 (+),score=2.32 NODE_4045_length_364_cov_2.438095_g3465_i0:87-308(+)